MNDDIRRALDDLVGQPPITVGRRGAVMQRIERVHTRRKVAMNAALSAFLVASVAFGASRVINPTPTSGADHLVEQPSEEPDVPEVPVESPEPEPSKTKTVAPTKSAAPEPEPTKQTAAPVQTKAPVDPEPTYTKKPEPTATKKPVVTGDPLSVELWPYTDAVAGQSMDWKVKAYDGAGRLMRIEVLFGDGQKKVWEPATTCGEGVAVKQFFPHTYAKAGTYTAKATVTTGGCNAATETKSVSASVKVLAEGTGNGPATPTVTAEQVEAELVKLALHGADADGYVKKFWVDWGDGSPETYVGPRSLDGCVDGAASQWDTTASHAYETPGSYTVTVTVMSVNCDAGQGQTASMTLTVTA